MKSLLLSALLLFISVPALSAGVSLNATRLVYVQGEKSISIHARNNTNENYLSKFTVTDADNKISPLFTISPPLVKILKGSRQEARIYIKGNTLPDDRETVFYFHATMIPATDSSVKTNALSIAYDNIIKLFYRPANLKMTPEEAYSNLSIKPTTSGITVVNDSPYYITFSQLVLNGTKVGLDLSKKNTMISPFSSFNYAVPVNARKGLAEWTVINDLGGENVFSKKID
ncbi:fimbrial biogenesis chaperone [Morganella morganii]|uniref:fimbrial biogenesis chaperone n=1 Tax=Morganella morganii TaxID=582 RepID=UPI0023684422|nr:molecular chaperone [Morganella morganii]